MRLDVEKYIRSVYELAKPQAEAEGGPWSLDDAVDYVAEVLCNEKAFRDLLYAAGPNELDEDMDSRYQELVRSVLLSAFAVKGVVDG